MLTDDRENTSTSIGVFGWLLFGLSWVLVAITLPFSLCVLLKVRFSLCKLYSQSTKYHLLCCHSDIVNQWTFCFN